MDKFSDVVDGGDGVGALRRAPAPLQRPFSSSSLLTRRAGSFASRPGTAGARAATTVGSRSRPATAASSRRGFGDEGGDARAEPYVSRYGCVGRRPDSAVPFGDAPRQTGAPSGTDAPFSYLPPPASARDPNSDLRNPAQVVMAVSTREQWFNVHQKVQSSDSAGPGAYDLPRGERVLLHVAHHGVGFPHDAR